MRFFNFFDRPLVSFIVSVYNLEAYIGACLDSLLAQPFDDYEIVLVNNNSSDGSDRICRDYAARFKKIRYFSLSGEPIIGKAVRHGLINARGKYLHIVDGDDRLPPNVYGEISFILRTQNPDLLFGKFNPFFEGSLFNFTDTPYEAEKINHSKEQALDYLAEKQPFVLAAWRFVVSRKVWLKRVNHTKKYNPTKPTNIYLDTFLNIWSLLLARSIHYLDQTIYQYRVRTSSISRISAQKNVSECCEFVIHLAYLMRRLEVTLQERRFVFAYMRAFHYLLATALCTLNDEEIREAASVIKTGIEQFDQEERAALRNILAECGDFPYIAAFLQGNAPQHNPYAETLAAIASAVREKRARVYLAPTGNVGVYLHAAFTRLGIDIAGFFDNDEKKDGAQINGRPVRLPAAVAELTEHPVIIIASMYPNVRDALKKQFFLLGIPEHNLFVVEFQRPGRKPCHLLA